MINTAVQGFPLGGVALQNHVAVAAACLGDGHGAGVQVKIAVSEAFPGRNVGVTVEQDISRLQRRQRVQIEVVTVVA